MSYAIRQCCLDGEAGWTFVDGPDETWDRLRIGPVVKVLSEPPPPPPGAAIHEASHAVVAVAVGGSCEGAVMGFQPRAFTRANETVTGAAKGAASVAVSLAGPIGQRVFSGALALEPRAEIAAVINRIERCGGGSCDLCSACSVASLLAPVGDEAAILETVQSIEFETLQVVRHPDAREAIRQVAAVLEERGEISGAEVHRICDRLNVTGRFVINLSPKPE